MQRPWRLSAGLVLLCAGSLHAGEGGEAQLRAFLASTGSLAADFTQEVTDSRGRQVEASSGRMLLKRPGRFRWDYAEPHERLMLADGERVWLYEPDLEQATTRGLDDLALRDTPAALLTGTGDVLDRFVPVDEQHAEGLDWITLEPVEPEADFHRLRLGFAGGQLQVLELDDRLGQQTRVRFAAIEVNPALDDADFTFVPPPGVDIIGEDEL